VHEAALLVNISLSEIERLVKIDSGRPPSSSDLKSANRRNSIHLIKTYEEPEIDSQ
jgi:hypothetical protein